MTPLEVFAAIAIALFTMIGGVLLNAAITSPRNCIKTVEFLHKWVRSLLGGSLALAIYALLNRYIRHTSDSLTTDPLMLISIIGFVFFGLFLLAEKIAMVLTATNVTAENHTDVPNR
ncbi:hypothetical protein [Pseudophaeobacter arcticus]|uniref:hypothetical protein n=1 Tax=Pseudophaeobacter arcticus TaxID=385492 RepID=UPI003A972C2A